MRIIKFIGLVFGIVFSLITVVKSQVDQTEIKLGAIAPVASFYGKENVERIGYALAGAGDVNGDGFDDFLIGTFHNDRMGMDAGAVYLFLGHQYLHWGLDDSVSHADARFLGQTAYDAAGYSVACDGDLNGDGFDDMIIGAPAGNDKASYLSGRVYIVFGKPQADWGSGFQLYDSSQVIYEGEENQDLAGLSVAYVGDVNNDGFDDFLVGAPFKDANYVDMGKSYLVLGRSTSWLKNDYLLYADASFIFEREDAQTGYSVAGIGDVNDDGVPDFAIGATGASRVFIIFGRTNVNWGKNYSLDNADLILYGSERWVNEGVGWKVAGNGDINGDGISDIIVSAIHDNETDTQAGKIYVLFGRSGGWDTQEIALKDGDASFLGEQSTDQAGWGLAIVGDIDGDGFDDFQIGTYKDDHGPVDGKAYLIRGKATGWQTNIPLGTITEYCERNSSGIGFAISTAGDFDQDGLADFIVSAPFNSDVQKWNGKVYLFASQEIPYEITGKMVYYQSEYPIKGATVWVDTSTVAGDTTDSQGQYKVSVRGKNDHTIEVHKGKGEDVGNTITSYDAALIAQLSINLNPQDTINAQSADVNLDGRVNMYDAANTLRYAVDLPPLADSRAGEWAFVPGSMFYDSVVAHYSDQNYIGFVRGDVDMSWQLPDSGLLKNQIKESLVSTEMISQQDEVILLINFNSTISMLSFDLDVKFEQNDLEFLRIEKTDFSSNFKVAHNNCSKNRLKIGAYSLKHKNGPGTLLKIHFKIKNTGKEITQISIDRLMINNHLIDVPLVQVLSEPQTLVPGKFKLYQNFPNPFNNISTIIYDVPRKGKVKLVIYNLMGREIVTLFEGNALPGKYNLTWDGRDNSGNPVTSGMYIGKAYHPGGNEKIKIIYMK